MVNYKRAELEFGDPLRVPAKPVKSIVQEIVF
jgi:hypothetical protein